MLSDAPSVLSACVESFCRSLLEYQKDLNRLNENGKHAVQCGWKFYIMLQIHGPIITSFCGHMWRQIDHLSNSNYEFKFFR